MIYENIFDAFRDEFCADISSVDLEGSVEYFCQTLTDMFDKEQLSLLPKNFKGVTRVFYHEETMTILGYEEDGERAYAFNEDTGVKYMLPYGSFKSHAFSLLTALNLFINCKDSRDLGWIETVAKKTVAKFNEFVEASK